MGGIDKGLTDLNGQPMIQYVLDSLSRHVSEITISTNNKAGYHHLGYPLVDDLLTNNIGPLAGIHAGLSNSATQRLLITPCDCPFLDTQLSKRLIDAMNEQGSPIAVAYDGVRLQAAFAVIDVCMTNNLTHYLNRGGRRLITWYKEEGAIEVDYSDVKDSFININTMGDIEMAEKKLINK